MSSKAELRSALKLRRSQLTAEQIANAAERVHAALRQLPEIAAAQALFVYVSCRQEVPTRELIKAWLDDGRIVTVPKTLDNGAMEAWRLKSLADLAPGPFQVPTPTAGECYPWRLDVCLAPGLAFTQQGDRLGYGKGHYDRFLERHSEMLVIGLAYDFQIVPALDTDPHDRPMDIIVTEERVIRVGKRS